MSQFIHLRLHSAYSLAEGAIKIKDLIDLCRHEQMPAVAVTDTNNLFGAMEFAQEAAKNGIQPIHGCQINVDDAGHQLVLLVQNETGYRNLCKIVSAAYVNKTQDGVIGHQVHTSYEMLEQHHEGLICLSGGMKGAIADALLHGQIDHAEENTKRLNALFEGRFYIELQRHGLISEDKVEPALIDLAYKYDIPLVATNDCYFKNRKAHEAHDALLCIAEGRYVTEDDRRKVTPEHYFKSSAEMTALFEDIPEAVLNTAVIAQRCSFLLKPIEPIFPPFESKSKLPEKEELEKQAREGLQWRLEKFVFQEGMSEEALKERAAPYWKRLDFELKIINQMGFPGYFLIVSDFIKWSKANDIPVGPGRGSGAGSVVAWALKITDLDPLQLGLLFERFLNPERVSMPDFDVDFCQDRRDEVIRYVQERYGYDHVAQIITFGKLQARAVVRDVGRVLQMPYGQVDRIAKLIPNNPANPMTLQEALDADEDLRAERDKDDTQGKLISIALQLEGLYRHASTHAAGVVIGDRPLDELIPLYRDPRSDMPVTQFNMKFVEKAGLVKFDFLGLKTMTVIHKALNMVQEQTSERIELLDIPLDDAKTYELMTRGNTVGVFQLESAGMRDVLKKVKPNRFEDIIALVSLYRPGPMDNIPRYIDVKEGREEPDYMHPVLEPFLTETYGIMIYQEQVMQAAQTLSGYTLGAADLLRRAMGKKIHEEMIKQRKLFVEGAKEYHNVPEKTSSEIFDQIAKFAGYGFNKAHAAAYALIAYWTAWLKANYPVEFMAASMALDLNNTDKLSVFKQDIDKTGLKLLPPDINHSYANFKVENGAVRYAMGALKGVGQDAMERLVTERYQNGQFRDLQDFACRLDPKTMNRRQFERMIYAGVFDSLHPHRAQLCEGVDLILRYAHSLAEERISGQVSLFGNDSEQSGLGLPTLPEVRKWSPLEQLANEFTAVGFYLSAHPLDTRQEQLERMNIRSLSYVEHDILSKGKAVYKMAGVLLKKQEKVSQKGSKYAFLQLSDPTGIFEVTIFSETLHAVRDLLESGNALLVSVDVEIQDDQLRFTSQKIVPLDDALDQEINEIEVHLNSYEAAQKLKEFLDIEGRGRSKIKICVHTDDERIAIIEVAETWALGAQARNAIRMQDGILKITER
ncbi:MAG: DNA polymerase III subunit alpha [Alphaproteobacteria bacterium]